MHAVAQAYEEKNSFSIRALVAVDSSKSGLTSKNNCFAVGRKKSSPLKLARGFDSSAMSTAVHAPAMLET